MMMLIIFLITDISMVGIFAGVYGNIAKYREGMLMGVHIPKSELEHPDIKELLQLYKKHNRQFYLWNMLAGIAVCLLCFTYFSIFITVWTLWFVKARLFVKRERPGKTLFHLHHSSILWKYSENHIL